MVAESNTSIEKYDANQARVTTNFPLVVTATIGNIKRTSGDRFVVLSIGNPDNPRVYNNDGTLVTSITGLGCITNCDLNDIVELPDGRFVVSIQYVGYHSLGLFNSSFTFVGQLYKNTSVMLFPGPMAVKSNGNIVVCTTVLY